MAIIAHGSFFGKYERMKNMDAKHICVVCGNEFKPKVGTQKCCGKYCSRIHKHDPFLKICRFNIGVRCEVQKCESCGWNPEVDRARREKGELSHGTEGS